jgi:hypothetical protein
MTIFHHRLSKFLKCSPGSREYWAECIYAWLDINIAGIYCKRSTPFFAVVAPPVSWHRLHRQKKTKKQVRKVPRKGGRWGGEGTLTIGKSVGPYQYIPSVDIKMFSDQPKIQ